MKVRRNEVFEASQWFPGLPHANVTLNHETGNGILSMGADSTAGTCLIEKGDYILSDPKTGTRRVVTAADFLENYEVIGQSDKTHAEQVAAAAKAARVAGAPKPAKLTSKQEAKVIADLAAAPRQ